MPYRDETPRISIAQVRVRFLPRVFRALSTVVLREGDVTTEVRLATAPGSGALRSARRWFVCPRCGQNVNVVGMTAPGTWVCARCGRWRSRNRLALAVPPSEPEDQGPSAEVAPWASTGRTARRA